MISKNEIKRLCRLIDKMYNECDMCLKQVEFKDVTIVLHINEATEITSYDAYVINNNCEEECITIKATELT